MAALGTAEQGPMMLPEAEAPLPRSEPAGEPLCAAEVHGDQAAAEAATAPTTPACHEAAPEVDEKAEVRPIMTFPLL